MRQPFSIDRLEVTGRATPLADDVLSVAVGVGDFSASGTGVLAYREEPGNQNQFAWVSRSGRLIETVGPPGRYRTPALSPDGKRLAFTDVGKADIWIYDLGRRSSTRFTSERDIDTCPVWAPDGTKIYYRNDGSGLFEKSAAGSGPPRRLLDQFVNGPSQVSRDGKWLLYFAGGPTRTLDVVVLPLTGSATPKPVVETAFSEVEPQWSPDGRWLAYVSNETGRNEVYVQPFPASGERWRVSTDGGRQPLWRADGRELFFVSEERKFYAMAVTAKGAPFDSAPQYLFEMRANVINTRNSYLPSADGQRFLVNMVLDTPDPPINVVVNWAAGLK
jgi:Tol biopolymer transport system component